MIIEKLDTCHHNGEAIISERLATIAGCQIKLWALFHNAGILGAGRGKDNLESGYEAKYASTDIEGGQQPDKVAGEALYDHRTSYTSCICLFTTNRHSPYEISAVKWSPNGQYLASADNNGLLYVHELDKDRKRTYTFDRSPEKEDLEAWKVIGTLRCPEEMGQFFDIAWAWDSRYLIGGGIKGQLAIFDIHSKEVMGRLEFPVADAGFVKGVVWSSVPGYIAAQSSNKHIAIWRSSYSEEKSTNWTFQWKFNLLLISKELFDEGPGDAPSARRISFDPTGAYVSFPYGERSGTCFGVLYDVSEFEPSFSLIYRKEPFRFRGHQSRVNSVSFNNCVLKAFALQDATLPDCLLYAQGSEDGCISIWRLELSSGSAKHKVELSERSVCLYVITKLLDEQSCISGLAWGKHGRYLAVGSSSGSVNLIIFSETELGVQFNGLHHTDETYASFEPQEGIESFFSRVVAKAANEKLDKERKDSLEFVSSGRCSEHPVDAAEAQTGDKLLAVGNAVNSNRSSVLLDDASLNVFLKHFVSKEAGDKRASSVSSTTPNVATAELSKKEQKGSESNVDDLFLLYCCIDFSSDRFNHPMHCKLYDYFFHVASWCFMWWYAAFVLKNYVSWPFTKAQWLCFPKARLMWDKKDIQVATYGYDSHSAPEKGDGSPLPLSEQPAETDASLSDAAKSHRMQGNSFNGQSGDGSDGENWDRWNPLRNFHGDILTYVSSDEEDTDAIDTPLNPPQSKYSVSAVTITGNSPLQADALEPPAAMAPLETIEIPTDSAVVVQRAEPPTELHASISKPSQKREADLLLSPKGPKRKAPDTAVKSKQPSSHDTPQKLTVLPDREGMPKAERCKRHSKKLSGQKKLYTAAAEGAMRESVGDSIRDGAKMDFVGLSSSNATSVENKEPERPCMQQCRPIMKGHHPPSEMKASPANRGGSTKKKDARDKSRASTRPPYDSPLKISEAAEKTPQTSETTPLVQAAKTLAEPSPLLEPVASSAGVPRDARADNRQLSQQSHALVSHELNDPRERLKVEDTVQIAPIPVFEKLHMRLFRVPGGSRRVVISNNYDTPASNYPSGAFAQCWEVIERNSIANGKGFMGEGSAVSDEIEKVAWSYHIRLGSVSHMVASEDKSLLFLISQPSHALAQNPASANTQTVDGYSLLPVYLHILDLQTGSALATDIVLTCGPASYFSVYKTHLFTLLTTFGVLHVFQFFLSSNELQRILTVKLSSICLNKDFFNSSCTVKGGHNTETAVSDAGLDNSEGFDPSQNSHTCVNGVDSAMCVEIKPYSDTGIAFKDYKSEDFLDAFFIVAYLNSGRIFMYCKEFRECWFQLDDSGFPLSDFFCLLATEKRVVADPSFPVYPSYSRLDSIQHRFRRSISGPSVFAHFCKLLNIPEDTLKANRQYSCKTLAVQSTFKESLISLSSAYHLAAPNSTASAKGKTIAHTMAHCEHQILSAALIHSGTDFLVWLKLYFHKIREFAMIEKIRYLESGFRAVYKQEIDQLYKLSNTNYSEDIFNYRSVVENAAPSKISDQCHPLWLNIRYFRLMDINVEALVRAEFLPYMRNVSNLRQWNSKSTSNEVDLEFDTSSTNSGFDHWTQKFRRELEGFCAEVAVLWIKLKKLHDVGIAALMTGEMNSAKARLYDSSFTSQNVHSESTSDAIDNIF